MRTKLIQRLLLRREEAAVLYRVLMDVTSVLEKHRIFYSITDGTLLGAVRNREIIGWDDDLDVMTLTKYESRLKDSSFIKDLNTLGYNIVYEVDFAYHIYYEPVEANRKPKLIRISQEKYWEGTKRLNKGQSIGGSLRQLDIFIYGKEKDEEGRTYYNHVYGYEDRRVYKDELYPLTRYQFGPLSVYGMSNADAFITRWAGPQYRERAMITHVHRPQNRKYVEKLIKKKANEVTEDSYLKISFGLTLDDLKEVQL